MLFLEYVRNEIFRETTSNQRGTCDDCSKANAKTGMENAEKASDGQCDDARMMQDTIRGSRTTCWYTSRIDSTTTGVK